MRSYILSTVSLFALVAYSAENENGSAETVAPRVLPDLAQASALAAELAATKATAKAADTAKAKAKAAAPRIAGKAKVSPTVKRGVDAQLRESVEEASNKRRKISKAGPLLKPLHKLLSPGKAMHIAALAKSMKCTEQDVRGAIDTLRRLIHPVNGVRYLLNKPDGAPSKTFGYKKGWKLPADVIKRIG